MLEPTSLGGIPMDPLASSIQLILSHLEDGHDLKKSEDFSDMLVRIIGSSTTTKDSYVKALLCVAQSVNRTILSLEDGKIDKCFVKAESPLDSAIGVVIRDCVGKSQYQINRAIDELLKRDELFDPNLAYPIESDELMLSTAERLIQDPQQPSSIYVPRQPRLPGLPVPPPDQFGDWDEYRDDLDPGYRVREVYEEEYKRECGGDTSSQSTSVTQTTGAAILFDDELLHTSNSAARVMDENDELAGAFAFVSKSQTPSVVADFFPILSTGSQRSGRTSVVNSPSFGERPPTLQYDYMGGWKEVARPDDRTVEKEVVSQKISVLSSVSHGREYPMSVKEEGRGEYVIEELRLSVIYEVGRTGFESSKDFDSSPGILVAGRYRIESHLGQAAFSKAVKAVDIHSDQAVCLKIIKNEKDFVDQSLDEIKILKLIKAHGGDRDKNCLSLIDCFYWREHLILVTELLLENLYEFSKFNRSAQTPYFTLGKLQKLTKQILISLSFLHNELGVIHCDLKPENILFESYSRCEAKVIDFGSACFFTDKLSTYVQSRSYRAPEIILGCLPYDGKIDMWSLGCIIAELWTGFVLFQNDSCQSLLARVLGIIGPIPQWMLQTGKNVSHLFMSAGGSSELFVDISSSDSVKGKRLQILVPKRTSLFQRMRIEDEEFLNFLANLLQIDPALRLSAAQALEHPWLQPGRYSDGIIL